MTDKVQKIREEVEKLHGNPYYMMAVKDVLEILDMQGEPISVWHDSGEMPKEKKVCLIRYSANDGASTNNFEVVIAEPLTRRFVTRSYLHKTGYQHTIHGENTIKVDEYQDRREYIPFSDIDKWAYIDDLLNLPNVERTVKNCKEEPVSEEKDIFDNCLKSEEKFILPRKISGNINCENCLYSSACALGDIQACIIDKPVSNNLDEEIYNEVNKLHTAPCYDELFAFARHFAEWGKKQAEIEIQAQSMALANGCPKELSEDLEQAAQESKTGNH